MSNQAISLPWVPRRADGKADGKKRRLGHRENTDIRSIDKLSGPKGAGAPRKAAARER